MWVGMGVGETGGKTGRATGLVCKMKKKLNGRGATVLKGMLMILILYIEKLRKGYFII